VRKKERTEKHKNQQDKAWTGKDYRVYLEPETYENIKAKSKAKYISMSDIMRQTVGKMVE